MYDFYNNEIHIGDVVTIIGDRLKHFINGIVVKETPKGMKVAYKNDCDCAHEGFVDNGRCILDYSGYKKFHDYMIGLWGQGYQVANYHLNGELEPLDNFIEEAIGEMYYYEEEQKERLN